MQVFVISNNFGIRTNAKINEKIWSTKVDEMMDLFGILANANVINHDVGKYLDYENCKCKNNWLIN